jgi:hypothetical protein
VELESVIDIHIDGQSRTRGIDAAIAALAERQHGVVARRQLDALGVGRGAIDRRLHRGRLCAIHRGVYGVGHRALSTQGRWMAAVLAAGPGAVLSHQSAAALWGLRPTARNRIDVTTSRKLSTRPGIHPHCAVLQPDEITTQNGIPTTTPARTLLDLAAVLPKQAVQRAVNEAEVLRLADATAVHDLKARHPRHRGISKLHADHHIPALTRSELEARFITFLDVAVLPRPTVNTLIEDMEVDFAWPEHRLIAELDGFEFHATRRAFERDRARDRRLQAHRWRVIRITWRQLHDDPERLAAELAVLLNVRRRRARSPR